MKANGAQRGRRKHPMPDGVVPPPRHRAYGVDELRKLFVSAADGSNFDDLAEDSTVLCVWKCAEGHRYEETRVAHNRSRGCPVCATSIATRMPGLMQFWDSDANTVCPKTISAYSREKVAWICEVGHRFERAPYRVLATGHQCQECRREGRTEWRIAGKRDPSATLADAHPEIVQEWDYDKNPRGPEEYAPGSQRVAYWLCNSCGSSWSSPICHRTSEARHPASCQQCKTIKYAAPELAEELHPTLNPPGTELRVRKGSSEPLHWVCKSCDGHVWTASVASRLRSSYPASCPKCRSLAIKAPDLIEACWDYSRNAAIDPEEIRTSSSDKAWWLRVDALHIPAELRTSEHYEYKRIGYRYRRYINNPEREVLRIRTHLERERAEGEFSFTEAHRAVKER
ncbi:MAG: zinc-ribbon domain-containing protein [Pseudomonadota bacterium]